MSKKESNPQPPCLHKKPPPPPPPKRTGTTEVCDKLLSKLLAKEALFDELVDELESSTGKMRFITGFDQERKRRIEVLLTKCKAVE